MRASRSRVVVSVAVFLLAAAATAFAQSPAANKALIVGKNSRMYIVDFTAGTATALPYIPADKAVFPSPDLSYVITWDNTAMTLYKVSSGSLQQVKTITGGGLSSVAWSPDSASFVYAINVDNPDKSVSVEIHQWTIATAQDKRLL